MINGTRGSLSVNDNRVTFSALGDPNKTYFLGIGYYLALVTLRDESAGRVVVKAARAPGNGERSSFELIGLTIIV